MRRALALTTLLALLASCSSGGGGGGEGSEDGERSGAEPRATTTLIDNLYDRVDAGDWTLAEGLVATLEYLNNERKLRDVVPSGELVDFEGTAIIGAARAYLDGDPGAEEARIRELVSDLLPTPEELRQLAGETMTAALGPPRDFECSDVWRGDPEGPPAGTRCLGVETLGLPGGRTARIYSPLEGLAPEQATVYQALVREALPAAWGVFSGYGAMPDVDVVVDPRGRGSSSAMAGMATGESTCVIVVFPMTLADTPENARFILAHEAFGCFLQFTLGGARSADADQWWTQGSENYFANVVYPNANTEYVFLDGLREYEGGHTLPELSYDAFPFFQHLGNTIGDTQTVAFVLGLGRGANPADWPDMAELFHSYAEGFLTDRIIDSSGSPIPIAAKDNNQGRYRPTAPGPVFEVATPPFMIQRVMVDWEEQHEYGIDLNQPDGTRVSAQEHPAGAWAALTDPVRTCEAPLTQRIVMTRVTPNDDTVRLKVVNIGDVDQCDVRIVVHGAIEAEFVGGICYVEGGFLMVTAGYHVFGDVGGEQAGPYPHGYAFILGTATPGAEPAGFPDVTIADDARDFTSFGSGASLTKSADLLTGTFTSDDISGEYSCPEIAPPEVVRPPAG